MAKSHYADYVTHCMKFYTRFPKTTKLSHTEALNIRTCKRCLNFFLKEDQEILVYVYKAENSIANNVLSICKDKKLSQNKVWKLIKDFGVMFATFRGLI